MRNHIPIIILDELSWKSKGRFNPNALPKELKNITTSCGDQLVLIENSLSNTIKQI